MNIVAEAHYNMTLKRVQLISNLYEMKYIFKVRDYLDIETKRDFLKERTYMQNQSKLCKSEAKKKHW